MSKPHKYAEVIKAWADGKMVQFKYVRYPEKGWSDWPQHHESVPGFCTLDIYEWRIKPQAVRYRRYLANGGHDNGPKVYSLNDYSSNVVLPAEVEVRSTFIRWIDTDWQEVEV